MKYLVALLIVAATLAAFRLWRLQRLRSSRSNSLEGVARFRDHMDALSSDARRPVIERVRTTRAPRKR